MNTPNTTRNFKELITLKELFEERYFCIPDYQRGFSWEIIQLDDLVSDIEKLLGIEQTHIHYTGTIVLTEREGIKNKFAIVDGQQRLTTLIILLHEIYLKNPDKYKEIFTKYILTGTIGNECLKINPDDINTSIFIKDRIFGVSNTPPEIKSHSLLIEAKKYFQEWLFDKEDIFIEKIFNIIENKLGFLIYTPNDGKEIGIMFEVINNRGKRLSELEKIKNYFIYYATIFDRNTLRETINKKWGDILRNLSKAAITDNEDENSFLRNCYIVFYYASKTKSWYVYNEIKEKFNTNKIVEQKEQNEKENLIDSNIKSIQSFIDFLERASRYYAYLEKGSYFEHNYSGVGKKELSKQLKLLRCQHAKASILPLYLSVMDRYQNDSKSLLKLLDTIEKLNFRVYILPKIANRADTYQGSLFWVAYLLFNSERDESVKEKWVLYSEYTGDKKYSSEFDKIKDFLESFTQKHCNEYKFVQSLTIDLDEEEDYYNWKGLRYFLANYEYELKKVPQIDWDIENILITLEDSKENKNNYLSIEHIWASNNRVEEAPIDYIQKRRLGNFVLLGLSDNIRKSKKDISDKYNTMEIQARIELLKDENIKKRDADFQLLQIDEIRQSFIQAEEYLQNTLKRTNKTHQYYKDLSARINDIRETKLIKFALERWSFEGEKLENFSKVDTFEARDTKSNESYVIQK